MNHLNHLSDSDRAALATQLSRRAFLNRSSVTMGSLALMGLLNGRSPRAEDTTSSGRWQGIVQPLHFAPKAKRIIWLCMAGGPSHLETLDYKPKLAEMHGHPMPESYTSGMPIAQLQGAKLSCFGPQHPFKKYGNSGQEICEIFPHIGSVADDLCVIKSIKTEAINHDPAHTYMNTGTSIPGRPALGAWLEYGLGSSTEELPNFVVLTSLGGFGQGQPIAARQWHSGFLPSRFQGVEFRSKGDPVNYVRNPMGVSASRQSDVVQTVQSLNLANDALMDDPEVAARISSYETAFKMQTSVPGLVDLSDESADTLGMYGVQGDQGSFARNCLLARRLVERDVRMVHLYHRGWDHHGGLKVNIARTAQEVDQGCGALIKDLKQRGLLEETLVVWGGEFGRTPMAQGDGRDHHMQGFAMWLAGAGIKPGISYGATDELGYKAVENVVHVNDLHATILHLFGMDHLRLTYRVQGRDFRLTDIAGQVVTPILA